MSNAERLLLEDAELNVQVLKKLIQQPDLPYGAMEPLTLRILNCEHVIEMAKDNILLTELKLATS